MKRYGTSITALAVAGALTLSIAPNATAQTSTDAEFGGSSIEGAAEARVNEAIVKVSEPVLDPVSEALAVTAITESTINADTQPNGEQTGQPVDARAGYTIAMPAWAKGAEAGTFGGKTWYYHVDGIHVVDEAANADKPEAATTTDAAKALSIIELAVMTGRAVPQDKLEALRADHEAKSKTTEALPDWAVGAVAATVGDTTWHFHADRIHVVKDKTKAEGVLPDGSLTLLALARDTQKRLPENLVQRTLVKIETPAPAGTPTGSSRAFDFDLEALPEWIPGNLAGTLNGQEWYYSEDWRYVVNNLELVNKPAQEGQAGWMSIVVFAEQLGKSIPEALRGQFQFNFTAKDAGTAAAIILPAMLVIGGVVWYLNQDGRTYMLDATRTSSVPTADEREASEAMLSSNRAEVAAQIEGEGAGRVEAAAETRGITAETGSNAIGKGLIALLIASVLGAAVFAFGRRQLV